MSKERKSAQTVEFKQSSAKLAVESERPICQTAKDLGINAPLLYTWVKKFYPNRTVAPASKESLQAENHALKRENARLKQEREILKKAAAYFAKENL